MSLSNAQKARLLAETAPAAKALAEDLTHVREVLGRRATSKAEIRRLSAVIRRLLVDGDLMDVATPRLGKLLVTAPDLNGWYENEKYAKVLFFAAGGVSVFGAELHALAFLNAGQDQHKIERLRSAMSARSEAAGRIVQMRLHNFLAQRVLCVNGHWVSRRVAIKHIANYGSGVHSKAPDNHDDKVCEYLRKCCTYHVEGEGVKVHVMPHFGSDSAPILFKVDPPWSANFPTDVLDPVLLEVLAAGAFITASPEVQKLEAMISQEP